MSSQTSASPSRALGPERRVVVIASASAGASNAERAAELLSGQGARVDVVALGSGRELASVATAGHGQFQVAADARSAAAAGQCAAFAQQPTGPVDAWLVARALVNGAAGDGATSAQVRFIGTRPASGVVTS